MKAGNVWTVGSFLLAGLAAVVSLARAGSDATLVVLPESRAEKRDVGAAAVASAAAEAPSPEREALADMLPPETLTAAMVETKQKVTFDVQALMDSGLSEQVAAELLKVAELQVRMFEQGWKTAEFFLAVWPDLSRLIREGRIKPVIAKLPERKLQGQYAPGAVWYKNLDENHAELCVNTHFDYQIRIVFTPTNHDQTELHAQMMEAKN